MALEKVQLDHAPPDQEVYVAFFQDVSASSTEFLQKELLARNPIFEYTLIDATSIISRMHLLSAVFNGLNAASTKSLITPNVHSEIVLSLGPNNNVSEAYRRYGFQAGKTTNLIVVKVLPQAKNTPESIPPLIPSTADEVWTHLTQHLQGATPLDLTDEELAKTTDWAKVRKYYKLNGVPALESIKNEEAKKSEMERLVIMAMALREL